MVMVKRHARAHSYMSLFTILIVGLALAVSRSLASAGETSKQETVRVAGLVLKWVRGDKEANFRRVEGMIREAAAKGAKIVVTTECFLDGYAIADQKIPLPDYRALGEAIPGGTYFKKLAALAAELKIYLVAGMTEADGDLRYNTVVLIGPDGKLIGKYRKQVLGHETSRNTAGKESLVFTTPFGKLGVMICADRTDPKVVRRFCQNGADFLICPSGGMFGPKRNDPIVQARSKENKVPIVFVHPVEFLVTGRDGAILRRTLLGNSMLIGREQIDGAQDARRICYFDLPLAMMIGIGSTATSHETAVELVPEQQKVKITIGGKPFTNYLYSDRLPKPSLFPLHTPAGVQICRGYPLQPVKGESTDHPHHVGIFFACDEVNRNQFWINSTAAPPHIRHVKTTAMNSTKNQGRLATVMDWIGKDGKRLLEERRAMVFQAGKDAFIIDLLIDLEAQEKVKIADPKNGLLGIRLADWLREPFEKTAGVIHISGAGSGQYLNSHGDEREKGVWGKRADWVALHGEKDGKPVGIGIFDHPKSFNHPTYWHARGYGLFAANPVGQGYFERTTKANKAKPLNLVLQPHDKLHFQYRVVIYDGRKTRQQLAELYREFSR